MIQCTWNHFVRMSRLVKAAVKMPIGTSKTQAVSMSMAWARMSVDLSEVVLGFAEYMYLMNYFPFEHGVGQDER